MNKTAYELMKMIVAVKAALPSIKTPFLCVHGKDDKIALPKSSQYLIDNCGSEASQKSVILFPNLKHEIFFEKKPAGPEALAKVVEYFETQFSLRADEQC
jgi:alpha-beta hydrolase superfamily lysophospholipase